MARSVSRRGRMKSDDERRIQVNSLFIEHEVDAKDLAAVLYASETIDCNDRDEILGGSTRLERTRRMLDILLLRGQEAFDIFLRALEDAGYEHVATRLRTTEVMMTPKNSFSDLGPLLSLSRSCGDLEPLIREASAISLSSQGPELLSERLRTFEATCLSLTGQDPGGLVERLKKIEDLWSILSRRVTRIEQRVQPSDLPAGMVDEEEEDDDKIAPIGEAELRDIKNELAELKTDTMVQVQELTSSNTQKAALIEDLLGEVEQKTAQLQEAQSRIEQLEQRIQLLEAEKAKSVLEVGSLREELDQHREHVKHQEDWFNAENLRMKNKMLQQETALKQQETKVNDLQETERQMRQSLEEQHDDLKEQRRLMEEQSYQLNLLTRHIMKVATMATNNNKSATVTNKTQKETDNKRADTSKSRKQSNTSGDSDNEYARDVVGGRDVTVDADVSVVLAPNASGSTNAVKPHTAQPVRYNHSKNNFNNSYHRTTFNTVTSNNTGNTTGNNTGNSTNTTTVSSGNNAVSLSVPPSAGPQHNYRGIKRSAPAPMFRGYNRKK